MSRHLVVSAMFLVLALLCLLVVGMSSATRASSGPGPTGLLEITGATLPHPSPMAEPRMAGAGSMSGEFADRRLASLGLGRAPWIHIPSERWFRGHPAWRHAGAPPRASAPARWC